MRPSEIWRTTPFKLTLGNGAVFAMGVVLLLGLIYVQTAGFLARQLDDIVVNEARAFQRSGPEGLPERITQAILADGRAVTRDGLFSKDGAWLAGNVRALPPGFRIDGKPRAFDRPGFRPGSRAVALPLPWGETLFVSHDAKTLAGLRAIILGAVAFSGALLILLGLAAAAALSLTPLRRIQTLQAASREVMEGKLGVRLPVSRRRDEMDMLAGVANSMMDETERLLLEVKSVGDNVAHDLRTPLTRLRARLYRVREEARLDAAGAEMMDQALAETDALLGRFRAILRIGEIERRDRRAGFETVDLPRVLEHVLELHAPLAEDKGVALEAAISPDVAAITADPALMFEAVSNLIDNAVKFTPAGGRVRLRLTATPQGPCIEVADNGPGVPAAERGLVLDRFYRSSLTPKAPGSGLGLSIVTAIARLHQFGVVLGDAEPGLRVTLNCWPQGAG